MGTFGVEILGAGCDDAFDSNHDSSLLLVESVPTLMGRFLLWRVSVLA